MWIWLASCYAALLMLLGACAGYVALFVTDSGRRELAYKVLRLVLGTGTGGAGVMGVLQVAQQLGWL